MLLLLEDTACNQYVTSVCLCVFVGTSIVYCLLPKDPLQVLGPGVLHLLVNCLKCVCVVGFPLPEPDLKTQATVTTVLGQANI